MASEMLDTGTIVGFTTEGPIMPKASWVFPGPVEPYFVLMARTSLDGEDRLKILAYLGRDELTELLVELEDMAARMNAAYEAQFENEESLAEHDRKESERSWGAS